MFFCLDVCLYLEAIYLLAAVERQTPGLGWTLLACMAAVDWVLQLPTRPLTAEERDELYGRAPYLEDEDD